MKKLLKPAFFLCLGVSAWSVSAHLVSGSLLPTGGGSYPAGTRLAIHWEIEQEHSGSYEISFSPAPPNNWTVVLTGIRNTGARFNQPMDTAWMIPANQAPTTTGRIRVWQKATGEPGNGAAPDTSNFYALISGTFAITSGTPIQFSSNENLLPGRNAPERVLIAQVDGRLISREYVSHQPRQALHINMR